MPKIGGASVAILLNGAERELPRGTTVAALVAELAPEVKMVAVELNGEIVTRQRWADTRIADHDRIELVRFVQGG